MSPPGPIPAYQPGTFALFTVQTRLPKIMADVTSGLAEPQARDPRWRDLAQAIATGGPIDLRLFWGAPPLWTQRIEGRTWADLPFFDLEFLFYRAINAIAADLQPGLDVFASARRTALADALPRVAAALDAPEPPPLESALLWSLSGNQEDLSQLTRQRASGTSDRLIADQRAALMDRLLAPQVGPYGSTVVILADNAGAELCFDLLLIDRLLAARGGRVVLHVKPEPMFVSDALAADVDETIDGFVEQGGRGRLGQAGTRLRAARSAGTLQVVAPPDWAEPRHMNALSPELAAALAGAAIVLAKGDLNYRRFFEDRAWPADTPVREASVAAGPCAFALRVLKSDCVAGLPAPVTAALFGRHPDWRSSGQYAIVQRVDRGG